MRSPPVVSQVLFILRRNCEARHIVIKSSVNRPEKEDTRIILAAMVALVCHGPDLIIRHETNRAVVALNAT